MVFEGLRVRCVSTANFARSGFASLPAKFLMVLLTGIGFPPSMDVVGGPILMIIRQANRPANRQKASQAVFGQRLHTSHRVIGKVTWGGGCF